MNQQQIKRSEFIKYLQNQRENINRFINALENKKENILSYDYYPDINMIDLWHDEYLKIIED
jgi:hypothetical protein